jgi:hypothetical protein
MYISSQRMAQLVAELTALRNKIVEEKRPVYTQGNGNVVRNFVQVAELTGQTPLEVLAVYLSKQIVSVMNLLTDPNVQDSERATRFADAINYLEIGFAMWHQKQFADEVPAVQSTNGLGGVSYGR